VPQGVDYNLWMGPTANQPFNPNRFHYNWHWFRETGNGEIGNNGPHMADLIIQGIDRQDTLPVKIASQGGRFVWNDQGETPNTQVTTYTYADGLMATLAFAICRRTRRLMSMRVSFLRSQRPHGDYRRRLQHGDRQEAGAQGRWNWGTRQVDTKLLRRGPQPKKIGPLAPSNMATRPRPSATSATSPIAWAGRSHLIPRPRHGLHDEAANAMLTRKYRNPFVMPEANDI